MVLQISAEFVSQIWDQAETAHPDEGCGVIAGPIGKDLPSRHIRMVNAAHSPTFYEFASADLLRIYQEFDDLDEEPVIIYHSHTSTPAYPSRTDIAYAAEPGAHYVLVSTREEIANRSEFRSFRIIDGEVTEEEVVII